MRRPVDARERESIARFDAEVAQLEYPYDEHANPTHVTGSAIVVGDRGVVLHRHKRLGLWLQPGGHIDRGERPHDAALREAREETGLPVELAGDEVIHVDVHPGPKGHTHLDLRFLVHAAAVDPRPSEGESQDVAWFTWPEAIAVAEPGLEGILRALQPGAPELRRAAGADAAAIAHVYLRSRRHASPQLPELHDEPDSTEWIAGRIDRDEVWVAEVDGVVVAEMILAGATLDHLFLDPAWMGRGLGERMLALALERGAQELWTHQLNAAARRFYERHGFVEAEVTDGAGNEERLPDVRYVLRG